MSPLTTRRPRTIVGFVLIVLAGLALAGSAVAKIAGIPSVQEQMAALGFAGSKLTLIAILELIGAALFLWPRTRSIGVLWISAYLGGAICAHVGAGEFQKAVSPLILVVFSWIGTGLLHPQMLWSVIDQAGFASLPAGEGTGRRVSRT
jgi:hypothetical protein